MPLGVYLLGLAILTAAGAVLRWIWLDHPMRYDESWSYLHYILPGGLADCLVYSAANNHVLYTLLVALAAGIGGGGPAVLRMPAFLAGVALVPACGYLAAAMSGRRLAGLLVAAFAAGSGVLIAYSVNSRGYSMLCLAAVLLAACTLKGMRDVRRTAPWVQWAVVAALGLFTIPLMLYPMIALAAVVLLQARLGPVQAEARRVAWRRLALAFGGAVVLAAILYQPVILVTGTRAIQSDGTVRAAPWEVYHLGLYALVADQQLAPKPIGQVAAALPGVYAGVWDDWTAGASWLWLVLVGVGLVSATCEGIIRRRAPHLLAVVLAGVLIVLTLLHGVIPLPRMWMFALPLVLAVASCGLAGLVGWIPRRRVRAGATAILLLATAGASAQAGGRAMRWDHLPFGDATMLDARTIISDCMTLADGHTGLAWDYEGMPWPVIEYYSVVLATPGKHFVPYLESDCRRVLVIVGRGQGLQSVLAHRPLLDEAYGPMLIWRRYASADVCLASRRP